VPEGIVPELLIFVGLVGIVAAVFFLSRRERKPPPSPPPRPKPPDALAAEAPSLAEDTATVTQPPPEVVAPERPSLRQRLTKSRRFLVDRLAEVFTGAPDEETWDDLEAALIQADVGVEVASRISADLRERAREHRVTDTDGLRALLADELVTMFDREVDRGLAFAPDGPTVWMVVGVNGTGKTTSIGKLANDLDSRGRSVALAAADTFRAAADEQLTLWAERSGAEVVRHQPGADPGAVAFDAVKFASARGIDVLIVDTAGRLHTKTPLMDELSKVRRVIEKERKVDECLLVIDATAGQNGLVQAREFAEAAGVSGVVLAKLDGTAKGGIALSIEKTLEIPIKLVGVGESIDDLEPFDPKTFVDALLS
jgi:fused signal recognition particle receptor